MKISIIGAGFVGSTTAYRLVERKTCHELVLLDINEGSAKGKALDMMQAAPFLGADVKVSGTSNYEDTANSDIVVVTAGFPRLAGMDRDDLLHKNAAVIKSVVIEVAKNSPKAIIICVTNPLDVMTYLTYKISGFDSKRVIGMAGMLDTVRLRSFIAEKLQVSASQVQTMVLGTHGTTMVPLISHSYVAGIPIAEFLSEAEIQALVERTIKGGAEIVAHLQNGSAYFAPAGAVFEMIQAIVRNQHRIYPVAAYLEGQYGVEGIYLGVPAKLGKNGVEEVVEMKLSNNEKAALLRAANHVKENIAKLDCV